MAYERRPGKFESSGAIGELFFAIAGEGFSDGEVGNPDWGESALKFDGPFECKKLAESWPVEVEQLEKEECGDLERAVGAILYNASSGSVDVDLFESATEFERHWEKLETEYSVEEEGEGEFEENARGIYHDQIEEGWLSQDDFVIRGHNDRFYVDLVGRGGTHITIGTTRGFATVPEAMEAARKEARRRDIRAAVIWGADEQGEMHQIGHAPRSHQSHADPTSLIPNGVDYPGMPAQLRSADRGSFYTVRLVHKISPKASDKYEHVRIPDSAFSDKRTLAKALRDARALPGGTQLQGFRVEGDKVVAFPRGSVWHSLILEKESGPNDYGYGPSATGYVLLRDGQEVMRGTEAEIWSWMNSHLSYSVYHAIKHEGYQIVPESAAMSPNARRGAPDRGNYAKFFDDPHEAYLSHFTDSAAAAAFEATALSIGSEFLPVYAIAVRDGGEPTKEYWGWLLYQFDHSEYQPNARRGAPDEHAARELELYIDNDIRFAPGSPEGIGRAVVINQLRKWKKGTYDPKLGPKAWAYVVESAAKAYDPGWSRIFTPATRDMVAEDMARDFERSAAAGEYDHIDTKVGAR